MAEGDGIGATLFRTYRLLTRFVAVVDFAVALTVAFTVGFGAGALVSASAQFPQNKKIGELLLDQRFISGVGNYLRADIMYCSKIHPNTEIGNIPPDIIDAKGIKIGLFHGPISGLKTDLGYDFGDHAYDVNKFGGLDVVLCGDIHKRSIFSIPGGKRGMMIGSTIAQNYGESLTGHGYGILDVETMEYTTHDLYNPKPFLSFKITSYDDILNEEEKLING